MWARSARGRRSEAYVSYWLLEPGTLSWYMPFRGIWEFCAYDSRMSRPVWFGAPSLNSGTNVKESAPHRGHEGFNPFLTCYIGVVTRVGMGLGGWGVGELGAGASSMFVCAEH